MSSTSVLTLRRAGVADLVPIVALAADSLGWDLHQPNAAWFRWKHLDNPFGPSPMWVAEDDEAGLVGFRTFLRWELRRGTSIVRAARAVDTATAPAAQGRGIFTQLTTSALDDLAEEGVQFVFNTPNDQSRPGYLKMGWQVVGRPRTSACPRSVPGLLRLLRARTSADKFSLLPALGVPAGEVFNADNADKVETLVASCRPVGRALTTNRTPAYLAWRYGFEPFHYHVVLSPDGLAGGCAVFRLRRRGRAVEAVIAEVLVPDGDPAIERHLLREIRRRSMADYLLRVGPERLGPGGFVAMPGQGPVLTWRGVTEFAPPRLADWALTLGDLELL